MSTTHASSLNLSRFKPYYLYRFIKWKMGNRSPIGVDIKLTAKCPLNCVHCAWRQWDVPDLPTEKWFGLLERAKEMGCRLAMFEGGEPTLRKDLRELVEYAKSLGFLTAIFTNGTNPIDLYSPDVFWISVDNIGGKHDEIRGNGVFKKIINNIERSNKKNIITWTTVSRLNLNDLESICEYFSNRVAGMVFSFFYPYKDVNNIALSEKERVEIGKKLLELKSRYNILNSDSFLTSLDVDYPVYPWAAVTISPDGRIHQGCPMELIEENYNCAECYMICCREPALAYHGKLDAISTMIQIMNVESSMLLWLKQKHH